MIFPFKFNSKLVVQNPIQAANQETMSYKIKYTCLQFSLVTLSLLFCLPLFAQKKAAEPSPYNFESVDRVLNQSRKILGTNYVFLVWKDGKSVYEKSGSDDFTAKSQAPMAGAANWMIAALVMTYVDEGKLSLDDKVSKYIPIFATYLKSYITIRNCLTNTTGIRTGEDEASEVMPKSKYPSLEEEVNAYASKRDIASNPSTNFFYSPVGPNIAARVLEVIAKKSFDRLMMERIQRPLKLRSTTFANEEGGALNASAGAHTCATDYMIFLTMLLNKGIYDDKRILSEKAVEEMETPQFAGLPVKFSPKTIQEFKYGLGAWITESSSSGASSVLTCPDFAGIIPFMDKCHNYAAILFVEKPEADNKKIIVQSLKGVLDEAIGGGCK
jgi:CubicO group peptidase (beta-lactamase class C family)